MSINFDYIIVGGGASGSALASILSKKGPTLLIERGANHSAYPQASVRQGYPQIAAMTYEQLKNQGSGHFTGTPNILGGGSALGGGTCWRADANSFLSLGLDFQSVESAFQFLEKSLCRPVGKTDFSDTFVSAMGDMGMDVIETSSGQASWAQKNLSGSVQIARSIMPSSGENRRTASSLFEIPVATDDTSIMDQGNLTVYLLSKVKEVMFNGAKEAIGVNVQSPAGSVAVFVRETGKIFLNAGAYETPKLLMLSGIGPSQILSKYNIPVVVENQHVGQHLLEKKKFSFEVPSFQNIDGDDTNVFDAVAFNKDYLMSLANKFIPEWSNALDGCSLCRPIDRTPDCATQIFSKLLFYGMSRAGPPNLIPYDVSQRRPLTQGNVTLASADYNDPPLVHDGWSESLDQLSREAMNDFDTIVDGVQDFVEVIRTSGLLRSLGHSNNRTSGDFSAELINIFSTYSSTLEKSSAIGLTECSFASHLLPENMCTSWDSCVPTIPQLPTNKEDLRNVVFDQLSSAYSISGTCRAGDVVDLGTFAVKGVSGLYISDLSVLTQSLDVPPMMTAMALGIMIGNSTEPVIGVDYELLPCVVAILCMVILGMQIMWVIYITVFKTTIDVSLLESVAVRYSARELVIRDKVINNESNDDDGTRKYDLSKTSLSNDDDGTRKYDPSKTSLRNDDDISFGESVLDETSKSIVTNGAPGWNGNDKDNELATAGVSVPNMALMQWKGVSCAYQNAKKGNITTLFGSFGCLNANEVTAVMGPSGASKSTLVDILAGRKSLGTITGKFSVLGKSFDLSKDGIGGLTKSISGSSAYIPQQEFFYPTQTVSEAVAFAANLKFGRGDPKGRQQFIHWCLDSVGLNAREYGSRKIGGELAGGISVRGLSGGERKRLALASVLALKPKMMFIDELTSGLDSENTLIVMKLLKELSIKHHVASVVIIHQPSPQVFELFDRLILLSRGRCMYSGYTSNLSAFYELNYDEALPASSVADDLIMKASSFDSANQIVSTCELDTFGTSVALEQYHQEPSSLMKLTYIYNRNLVNQYVRNVTNVLGRIVAHMLISIVTGVIFWASGAPTNDNGGLSFEESSKVIRTITFLMNIPYLLPFTSMSVFAGDKRFCVAESALGLYKPWMYGVAEVFLEFTFLIFASTISACITIPMCSLWNTSQAPWMSFLAFLSMQIASGLVGSIMVFCFTMSTPTQDLAFLVSSTVVTISLSLSGGFLAFSEMGSIAAAVQWVSPVKYSVQGILLSLLEGTTAEKVLEITGINTPSTVSQNLFVLFGIFALFSVMSIVAISRLKEVR